MHVLKLIYRYIDSVFLTLTGVIILFGSTGFLSDFLVPLSLILIFIFLGLKLIGGFPLKLPATFAILSLFVASLLIHTLLFDGKIIYFWMFFTGGMYWLAIYNLSSLSLKRFRFFLFLLGVLMCTLFVYHYSQGIRFRPPDNLFLPAKIDITHNHIGDLWAVILVLTSYYAFTKPSLWQLGVVGVGVVMMALSYSRSAVVSLMAGMSFVVYMLKTEKKFTSKYNIDRYLYPILVITGLGIFIYFSITKSLFFARPYFLEALTSLINRPLGVGMGNFETVSAFTNVAHNLVLEVVSGMGVFSFVFLFWLYKLAKTILNMKDINIRLTAVALAMFVNFFFDATYVIPGFFWLWFVVLAMI